MPLPPLHLRMQQLVRRRDPTLEDLEVAHLIRAWNRKGKGIRLVDFCCGPLSYQYLDRFKAAGVKNYIGMDNFEYETGTAHLHTYGGDMRVTRCIGDVATPLNLPRADMVTCFYPTCVIYDDDAVLGHVLANGRAALGWTRGSLGTIMIIISGRQREVGPVASKNGMRIISDTVNMRGIRTTILEPCHFS